ncbi:putative acetyltransferase [Thioalkalivibrio sulfidiphilus HL-EbGr7]|uniref:[Ribosomal protein bS18]-alanine N-acetyltransferase n=1 Tax=Thioalkalivibrio sulfidiphilus (strain HL-EbGR7) TaxID=396588 RepID=B8GUB1_THISH|nr:ribosomal protein S18-alanine N-acetyltransferase [Thioalkalivibrio sulfidiphilus]ACL73231.1 putative acetyltransferase [Thioalkalivibrio sulfidiphilus HL-EbGr7]
MSAILSTNPQLRPMRHEDLDEIMVVELSAYPYPWTEGIFRDCMRVGYSCWVMTEAQRLVGYGVMSMAVGECHVLNLCVRPECQGRGYGRILLRGLLDHARRHKVETAFLEVRPSNTPAVQLYYSEGFNEVGLRKRYYPADNGREDALVLARDITG